MKILLLLPFVAALLPVAVLCMQAGPPDPDPSGPLPAEAFDWDDLSTRAREQPGRYLEFLGRKTLSAGLYRIPAGEEDHQKPHDLDEVYYVVKGRSRFKAGTETWDAGPGRVLFVAAGVEHSFFEITEDLEVLVFFSTAPVEKTGR